MAMSALIKSLEDVMRKDAGLNGDAQYIEQITWLLFLKAFDAKEMEWEFRPDYRGVIPKGYRWRDWAEDREGITGDELIKFVDDLFDKLKKLDTSDGDMRKFIVRNVFEDINNYMKSGIYLRQLVTRINEKVDFIDATQKHTFNDLYEAMLKDLQSAGRAGEFYTPRPVTNFIVEKVNPKLGETVLDPACGTGGFLTSTIAHFGSVQNTEELRTLQTSVIGWEKKPLPYLLAMTNLILHDIEVPQIQHKNSLNRPATDYTAGEKVDVIVTNPPFGGAEDEAVKQNFPQEFRTSETADLFLVLIMYLLRDKGRAGIVLPDGFMFGDGTKGAIKKRLLEEFGLHTIIRLPQVFKPYANVNTNLLFFQKGVASTGVWFYRLDYPDGVKSFTKTRPILDSHFDPVRKWWENREAITVDGKDKARFYTVEELAAFYYDFDKCCPFPHEEEEILEPRDLIARYQAERSELNMDIDRVLGKIMGMLEAKE
jgi:type I restriction enzyme M protein